MASERRYPKRRKKPMDTGNVREGNPHYGYRMRLFNRHGFHLTILPFGNVAGFNEDTGDYAQYQILEFTSAGWGYVRIRGVYSNLYLAIDDSGELYGEESPRSENTVFIENFFQQYNTYLSKKHQDQSWYVGLKKNGHAKPANRTRWGQKAIQFLPIRV